MAEIEEGASTSTNASPRPSWLTPEMQALAVSIAGSVEASVSKLKSKYPPTIYKVRQTIREVNEVAYEPKMVSIGPYHHGKERLKGMEENKLLYLHSFLARNTKYKSEHYVMAMSELEHEARSRYYDNVDLQVGDEFVKMMVLDACFIVEIFLRFYPGDRKSELVWQQPELEPQNGLSSAMNKFLFHSHGYEEPTLRTFGMDYLIRYDMLLLENQIPFFVLQRIFEMACPVKEPHLLEKMALHFFDGCMPMNEEIEFKDSYYHLLHLFHSHLIPTLTDSEERNLLCNPTIKYVLNNLKNLLIFLHMFPCSKETSLPITNPREMIPCATDLQLAGVKFKKNEKSNNILIVKFSHGVLEITPFVIHYHSDTFFRNLIAFEQCCPEANVSDYFTTYVAFMDYLVNTSKDVALLHHNGIIDHVLGSDDDVAHLFNQLRFGIVHNFKGSYLSDVHDNVQKHYRKKWNTWRATLKRDYFTNPWSFISLMAAIILLLLTITQTFFTVLSYF